MAHILHLVVCLAAVMIASAYRFRHAYDDPPWHSSYDYESFVPMAYPHERMNARSAEIQNDEPFRTNEGPVLGDNFGTYNDGESSFDYERTHKGFTKILNVASKQTAISRRRGGSSNSQVVFPGPTVKQEVSITKQTEHQCARTGKLCEEVPDYPIHIAKNIIKKLGDNVKFLTMDKLDQPDIPEITQRVGSGDNNLDLCDFNSKIMYPKKGYDKDGIEHLVVNDKDNPIQGFKVEICNTTGESDCKNYIRAEKGYVTRCVQKQVFRMMLTIDKETNNSTFRFIGVPSCCSCVARLKPF